MREANTYRSITGGRLRGVSFLRSDAVFEAPAFVADFDNVTMVSEAVKECRFHLGIAEDRRPFAEGEVGGDSDRGAFV